MSSVAVPQADQIHVDLDPAVVLAAYARHRRRFAAQAQHLDEAALRVQSRCTEWSVADVLRHGCDVDAWLRALWSGGSPPFTTFNPNTTPHEYVLAGRSITDVEARDRFVGSAETMAADVAGSGTERWGLASISPLGVVPWWLSALHVFYDSWVHERDVFVPLGLPVPVEPDEATAVLTYSLVVVGTFVREPTDAVFAGVRLVTGAGAPTATPSSAETAPGADVAAIIDALSGRGSIEDALAGHGPAVIHRMGALARFFHSAGRPAPI